MEWFMKKEDKSRIDEKNVETTLLISHWPPFCYSFVLSISVLLLSHSVQLTSPSSLVCSLFYPVGVIRLLRRLKFVLLLFRGYCTIFASDMHIMYGYGYK